MNKVLLGLVLGGVLGVFDGLTAWFTPEVRSQMLTIVIGSTIKGMMAGVAAGWFARKVQSTAWGVVFGLAVGAALAYWVAAMQGKYYFEIMLPGSILGVVVGWATQRYGKPVQPRRTAASAAIVSIAMLAAVGAQAADTVSPADALAKLKGLVGTWEARVMTPDGDPTKVEYRVTAGGSAVVETLFAGTSHEMITVYTIDGKDLLATHYCAQGNQPTMKLAKATPSELTFDFVSVRGEHADDRPHIHSGTIRFAGETIEAGWSLQGADGAPMKLFMKRAK